MSEDMSTNRLAAIRTGKECTCTGITLNLVCLAKRESVTGHGELPISEDELTIKTQTLNSAKTPRETH